MVYQYISELKIAKDVLFYGNKNVNDIAYCNGYQNPQGYTSAFKKKFVVSPKMMKKGKQIKQGSVAIKCHKLQCPFKDYNKPTRPLSFHRL